MNRSRTIVVLVVVGGLLVLCLGLSVAAYIPFRAVERFVVSSVESDAVMVATVSDAIADYTLPPGFNTGNAISLGEFSMVTYSGVDGRSHINLIQAPASLEVDREALEQRIREASEAEAWADVKVIDEQPCQIRGQETTLVVSEGVSQDGQPYRSASALFAGKAGLALVNVSGPADTWNQEMVDTFIESFH